MSLAQTLLKLGFGVGGSAIFGLLLIKLIADHGGNELVGEFSLFRQAFQVILCFLSLGNGFAIINLVSTSKNKESDIPKIYFYQMITLLIVSLIALSFCFIDQEIIFKNARSWLSLIFLSMAATLYFSSRFILIGLDRVLFGAILQALPFLSMLITFYLLKRIEESFIIGYLISSIIGVMILFRNVKWPRFSILRDIDFEKSVTATIFTGSLGFFSILVFKGVVAKKLSLTGLGSLEVYLSLVSYLNLTFLTLYSTVYLQRVSGGINRENAGKVLVFVTGASFLLFCGFYYFHQYLISLYVGKHFVIDQESVYFLISAEFFKSIAWFGIFTLIGTKRRRIYVIFDFVANLSLISSVVFISGLVNIEQYFVLYFLFNFLYAIMCTLYLSFKSIMPVKYLCLLLALFCIFSGVHFYG